MTDSFQSVNCWIVVTAFAVTGLLFSCRAIGADPVTHTVEITGFSFNPSRLIIIPGDRIIWINRDIVPHTATATDDSWNTGEIAPNDSRRLVFTRITNTSYYCIYHPTMQAKLEFEPID